MVITNLLTNMVVLALQGAIPTNTPAFQAYALHVMLTNAQALALKWHLDESLIVSNRITKLDVTPYPEGFSASVVFDDRYIFGTARGDSIGFTDKAYYQAWAFSFSGLGFTNYEVWWKTTEEDFNKHRAVAQEWSRATNLLTLRKAQQLAESAMLAVGVPVKTAGFKKPTERK